MGWPGPQESEAVEESREMISLCQEERGSPAKQMLQIQTSAFKIAIEGRGPAVGEYIIITCPGKVIATTQKLDLTKKGRGKSFSSLLKHKSLSPKVHSCSSFKYCFICSDLKRQDTIDKHKQHIHMKCYRQR